MIIWEGASIPILTDNRLIYQFLKIKSICGESQSSKIWLSQKWYLVTTKPAEDVSPLICKASSGLTGGESQAFKL